MYSRIALITISIFLLSQNSFAESKSELMATELNQHCKEVAKGSIGNGFDKELAQKCQGYMSGFFDSMIVIEKVTGKKEFCIPRALPKAQNNLILSEWIAKNKEIASKTTAAVALYAAFKIAFPCS